MSSSIDYITCPKCGSTGAYREQDNKTCEVTFGCPNCDWQGESVEKEDRVKPSPKKNRKKDMTFICPECGGLRLGSVEQRIITYPITRIPKNGNMDYDIDNSTSGDGEVLAYQCLSCGYELRDEKGEAITDCLKVPKWIRKHSKKK
jgi:predicted RNA-binding Zn-ribbon protein involved in translation (DUF1610 family)